MFINGTEVGNDPGKTALSRSAGDGRIVGGRGWTNKDENYASVQVDELIFFNRHLSSDNSTGFRIHCGEGVKQLSWGSYVLH